jgi:hypothetical protein
MGTAGVALLGDPSDAVWWNPAALGFARHADAQVSVGNPFPGLASTAGYTHAAATCPIARLAGVGLSYTELDYPQPEERADGTLLAGPFGKLEQAVSASAGVAVLHNLSIGATAKWISIEFQTPPHASSWAYDAGALYRRAIDSLTFSVGVNVQNMGPHLVLPHGTGSIPLTRNLRGGVAVQYVAGLGTYGELGASAVLDRNWTLLAQENFTTWNTGLELYGGMRGLVRVSLRCGYYGDPVGRIQGPTYGVGLQFAIVTIDAGFIPQTGNNHIEPVKKVTVGLHFVPLPER